MRKSRPKSEGVRIGELLFDPLGHPPGELLGGGSILPLPLLVFLLDSSRTSPPEGCPLLFLVSAPEDGTGLGRYLTLTDSFTKADPVVLDVSPLSGCPLRLLLVLLRTSLAIRDQTLKLSSQSPEGPRQLAGCREGLRRCRLDERLRRPGYGI